MIPPGRVFGNDAFDAGVLPVGHPGPGLGQVSGLRAQLQLGGRPGKEPFEPRATFDERPVEQVAGGVAEHVERHIVRRPRGGQREQPPPGGNPALQRDKGRALPVGVPDDEFAVDDDADRQGGPQQPPHLWEVGLRLRPRRDCNRTRCSPTQARQRNPSHLGS